MTLRVNLMVNTANFLKDHVTYVKVNGTVKVDTFVSKTVSGQDVTFEFNIPESVKKVSSLDFYNSSNQTLAFISTNVDTTNDTRIKYTIRVRSGVA